MAYHKHQELFHIVNTSSPLTIACAIEFASSESLPTTSINYELPLQIFTTYTHITNSYLGSIDNVIIFSIIDSIVFTARRPSTHITYKIIESPQHSTLYNRH